MTPPTRTGNAGAAAPMPSAACEFRDGLAAIAPAMAAATPFAFLLGALAADRGLSPFETGLMSALVFAGSAQFVVLESWQSPAPWLLIGLATLVVNLRHVFMSASILRHMAAFSVRRRVLALFLLVDETWAFAEARAAAQPLTPAYYAGLAMLFYANWVASSVLGAIAGSVIQDPRAYGFDFAFIAIFIGLVMGFRRRDGFGAAVAASALAATAVHLVQPGPLSIIAGTLAGIAAAAAVPRPDAGTGEARP